MPATTTTTGTTNSDPATNDGPYVTTTVGATTFMNLRPDVLARRQAEVRGGYDQGEPKDDFPFAVDAWVSACSWAH